MKTINLIRIMLVFVLSSIACATSADWQLDNEESSIYFVSIKKSAVAEVHTFGTLQGSLTKSGDAKVVISLSSVETMIPIRDDRMKSMLFEVTLFPEAMISTRVDMITLNKMKIGDSLIQPLKLKLSLHGQEKEIEAAFSIVRLANNKLLVSSIMPLIVNADDFALGKGVEALREVAKLPSISTAVPVAVNLVFTQ